MHTISSTNQSTDDTLHCANDAILAIAGQLAEYSDTVWSADGNSVDRHPPQAAVRTCRKRLQKLSEILGELEMANW